MLKPVAVAEKAEGKRKRGSERGERGREKEKGTDITGQPDRQANKLTDRDGERDLTRRYKLGGRGVGGRW